MTLRPLFRHPVQVLVVLVATVSLVAMESPARAVAWSTKDHHPSPVPKPVVKPIAASAGSHGHPFGAAVVSLPASGYTENEFLFSGTTNTYGQQGTWASDGRWATSVVKSGLPYTTRMLVRRPTDPKKFNGSVVVEWLNVSTGADVDVDWSQSFQEFLREGYAWVGVSAQPIGVNKLKSWDPARYGTLAVSSDDQSYDIFSQAAKAIRGQSNVVMGGLPVRTVLATGQSQSAFRLVTYTDAIQPVARAYDGIMIHSRFGGAAPIAGAAFQGSVLPAFIRTDIGVPVFQLESETDVAAGFATARQPDSARLRSWEVAGTSHVDLYGGFTNALEIQRDLPDSFLNHLSCANPINDFPFHYAENAAWARLNDWVHTGVQPASAPPLATVNGVIQRDADGNALGGIRLPNIQVPIAAYSGSNSGKNPSSFLFCVLLGSSSPFSAAKLASLYPTPVSYVEQYAIAATKASAAGFMLPADVIDGITAAANAKVP